MGYGILVWFVYVLLLLIKDDKGWFFSGKVLKFFIKVVFVNVLKVLILVKNIVLV